MAQRITIKNIRQWLAEGRGYGHGTEYIPWIKIKKRGLPGKGNLQFRFIPELGRYGHLLSAGELRLVRLLLYLGVADLREQFPCWPWPYHHPLYQHPNFTSSPLPWSSGTLAIAQKIGVSHPRYPGTRLFHIPTIDVLATVHGNSHYRAVAFSVKPDPNDENLSEWDASKLAIQQGYCAELSIPWHLISGDQIPETLSENLRVLLPYSIPKSELDDHLKHFSVLLTSKLHDGESISISITAVANRLGIPNELGHKLFHRALWLKTLPLDLRKPWVMSEPAHLCDSRWLATTRDYLLGGN